jgi:hypothetical protein
MQSKKLLLTFFICLFAVLRGHAQLYIDNATFFIEPGATVTVQGDLTSNTSIQGTGKILMKGSAAQNLNMNNGGAATNAYVIPNLEVDNASNVTLTGNVQVGSAVVLTNGKVQLGNFNFILASTAPVTGASNTRYFVTNGTGVLRKLALANTAFTFPVGNDQVSYNPVSITNAGTTDNISVRCLANVYANGLTGTAVSKEVANTTWDITEAVAGGSNLSLTANWYTGDELPGFNRAKAGISYYIPTAGATQGWDLLNSQVTAVSGTGVHPTPYNFTRTGITSLGAFAVGFRPVLSPLLVTPKVLLQGAYSTAGIMTDNLRTLNLIPTTEPYTAAAGFTQSGSGGGETSTSAIVGSAAAATNDAITDWVFVQLHNATTGTVVSTRAALVQKDGDVVETDGVSPVNMAGNAAGNYYVSVRHRNHLGVRSLNNFALAKTTNTNYNFTGAQTQAFAGAVTNTPMTAVSGGFFALWGGNANGNTTVRYGGPNNDENQLLNTCLSGNRGSVLNGYFACDLNLNGVLRYAGPNNDENYFINTILSGNKSTVLTQPSF